MKIRIVPYRAGSESARLLAGELSNLFRYKVWRGAPKERRINLNWGSTLVGPNQPQSPEAIYRASNKLETLKCLSDAGLSVPPFTEDIEEARRWLDGKTTVVARTLLRASEGRGIVLADSADSLPNAPLYVKYIPKKKEYRVHVVNGQVIDVQEKRKKRDWNEDRNTKIRNTANGYVFCHEGLVEPEHLRQCGVDGVRALGLYFGAADIIYNEKQDKCYILEINTAPGLCESTAEKYAHAFASLDRV